MASHFTPPVVPPGSYGVQVLFHDGQRLLWAWIAESIGTRASARAWLDAYIAAHGEDDTYRVRRFPTT